MALPRIQNVEKRSQFPHFTSNLPIEAEWFKYLYESFSGLSETKLRESIFVEHIIRKLFSDENFESKMENKKRRVKVLKLFGNKKKTQTTKLCW